ncbi:PEP-CTERM/exosortase system-associated acyltransferase [Candidatus Entotheonella palauensis]|uniref:PEP-CTERM/exosortase system-associated acyltransferase n=1 Tax=Candidatus Entotheonella gemina TaxID=1429439 RepID=W4LRR6_9BACT|nr:PEP-CTERM/exosortase system-associated acyltransferase [Candidatus Entotheonella palauensis]ETX00411.1 MAG: hypothetical protein ETSY2_39135 [Candidatus Entotheonella gemina]
MEKTHLLPVDDFLQYFDVALASTPEQKQQVYRIRYNVYCEELKFEPAECFPDREESDEFDPQSLHCLITHKSSRMPAGCARLIPPAGPCRQGHLPFEKHCSGGLDKAFLDKLEGDRHTVCELSRLAVEVPFRRSRGAGKPRPFDVEGLDCSRQERRTFGLTPVACAVSVIALASLTGRPDAFCITEPFLAKYLRRFGLNAQRIGQEIYHRGWRAPYFIHSEGVRETAPADLRDLYDAIFERMKQDLSTATL